MIKIVHVTEWNSLAGGGFTAVDNLINTMLKNGFEADIHIVSFGDKDKVIYEKKYTIHFIKSANFPTARFWYLPRILKRKIFQIRPDLIHLHFTYPPYSFVTQLSIPVIITTHGLSAIKVKGSYSKRHYLTLGFIIDSFFEKKALKKADGIIAVSKWIKQKVDDIIGMDEKTVYIPNGIDCNKYTEADCIPNLNHPSIIIIGRLVKFKGIDIAIESISIVKRIIPNIHLYVVGEGVQRDNLTALVKKLNIEENITFLGYIPENKKINYLLASDIFIIPSRFETFGIVVLEALASGTPIIASNVGGIPDILNNGEYGILVEPENPEALANAIIKLISNPILTSELRKKSQRRAHEYSWDNVSEKTVELYKSFIQP